MKAEGNGTLETCVKNLLCTYRTEVSYARGKGINHSTLDLPDKYITQQLNEDADNVIENYEPRASENTIEVDAVNINENYEYQINVKEAN